MHITNIWLEGSQYNELLEQVFGYRKATNCVYVGDQPEEFVERLLVALDLADPYGYSLEYGDES